MTNWARAAFVMVVGSEDDGGGDRETIEFSRPCALIGVETMRARDSDRHWRVLHETYTLCNALPSKGAGADWVYRGKVYSAHAGITMLIEPGETHANVRKQGLLSFDVLFIHPDVLDRVARELGSRNRPTFRTAQAADRRLFGAIGRVFASLDARVAPIEIETRLERGLHLALERHGGVQVREPRRERAAVARACELLRDRLTANVTLDELAEVSRLSRFALLHAFAREMGMPPHSYQLAVRIARGRELLARGMRPTDAATELGFADQSHFGRHFARLVGVPPGRYAKSVGRSAISF